MKTPRLRRFTRLLLSPALAFVLLQGCTDLDESPTSVLTPDNFFQTEAEVLGSLASVYAGLKSAAGGAYFTVNNVSSDEMIVPTRGSDWDDGGKWLALHRQTWTPIDAIGLQEIQSVWNDAFRGIARANLLLEALEDLTVANQATIVAELRTLRAFYYYMLMDMFGGVPIVEDAELGEREKNTRAEVFQFIDAELTAVRADLPDNWPAGDHGRLTKGAVDAILASMYLNAGVFTTDAPSATTYNSCTAVQVGGQTACAAAIEAADRILNSGQYNLETDFTSSFVAGNFASPENILVAKFLNQDGLGLLVLMTTLHYNMYTPSPWNGFAALAETYNAFDADDQRREILLEGEQVHLITGEPVFERDLITRLNFTVGIIDATQAGEGEGTRNLKWPVDPARAGPHAGNDVAFFRLAGIMLIKAEAQNELTPGSGRDLLNTLRERVFDPDEPITAADFALDPRGVILQERLFELTFVGKRRQDLIRHGRYTAAWSFKQAGAPHLVLMSIPQTQLDANPLLVQNPGYN